MVLVLLVVDHKSNDTNVSVLQNKRNIVLFSIELVLFRVFDRDHDRHLDRSDVVHMSSCLIDVAQFVYALGVHMNDSPDVFADYIFERYPVSINHVEYSIFVFIDDY